MTSYERILALSSELVKRSWRKYPAFYAAQQKMLHAMTITVLKAQYCTSGMNAMHTLELMKHDVPYIRTMEGMEAGRKAAQDYRRFRRRAIARGLRVK